MGNFEKTLRDIKYIKIQGAENVAKAAVISFSEYAKNIKSKNEKTFLKQIGIARKRLLETRPTEPLMRNSLDYILENIKSKKTEKIALEIMISSKKILEHFKKSEEVITEMGSRKIEKGMVVFTHCHSSTVMNILAKAAHKKKFEVHNTEARPLLQGRKTAAELGKLGIKVTHFVDSAARLALKKSDIFLMGADAITSEGKVINKIGSELFAETAERYDIPVYVCSNSWKFDPKSVFGYRSPIELRPASEIWQRPPKNVKVMNFAFERIDSELITAIISELGIYQPGIFVEEVENNYPWLKCSKNLKKDLI
jgi:ribose 1,5-bisphosphate isomerase